MAYAYEQSGHFLPGKPIVGALSRGKWLARDVRAMEAEREQAMVWEPVIGLEIHAQLLTKSKMFCGCSAGYAEAPPNTHVCPVCAGMPGVLPVINREAVRATIMTALALHCAIPGFSKFDRKNYFYPDLPKGYQISQYDLPLSRNGYVDIDTESGSKRIGIVRVHLEEDTANRRTPVKVSAWSTSIAAAYR